MTRAELRREVRRELARVLRFVAAALERMPDDDSDHHDRAPRTPKREVGTVSDVSARRAERGLRRNGVAP